MFLELTGLTKTFGEKTVISDLDLRADRGELVCLLGSSGCGKTTTLRMVGGFLVPDAGSVCVDGQDITTLPPERRPVSTVFQNYALFPHLDVERNVAYGLKFQGVRKAEAQARAREMLEVVGMQDFARARIDEISGGQQQRVALARSLVLGPKVLLLDEPLSNLDAALRVQMRAEIRAIQQQLGITMLFVTHDREEAMSLGDRIAIMDGGRLRQVGTPEEVYDRPADEFCANFLGHVNELPRPGGVPAGGADDTGGAPAGGARGVPTGGTGGVPAGKADGVGGPAGKADGETDTQATQNTPSKLRFRAEDALIRPDGSGAWQGTVTQATFLGATRLYHVDVGGSDVLLRCDRAYKYIEGDILSFDIAREVCW